MKTPARASGRAGATGGAVQTPPDGMEIPLRLVCISTDVLASAALQSTVAPLIPGAVVEAADTSIVRSVPEADCVILAVGRLYSVGVSLVRELRARGYEEPIILVVESQAGAPREELSRLGVNVVLAESNVALQLPDALLALLTTEAVRRSSPQALAIVDSLRRLRALIASGEIAGGLQHKLNNPLAALLAEAQLLELEPLAPEHMASVGRIIELCRRVIEVSRSIEGIGGTPLS